MSSPPRTPTHPSPSHRRHPSSFDLSLSRTNSYNNTPYTPSRVPLSRRSSTVNYQYSPTTPRSAYGARPGSSRGNDLSELDGVGVGGLGNLADELADLDDWDEEVEERGDHNGVDSSMLEQLNGDGAANGYHHPPVDGVRDSGVALLSSPAIHSPQQADRRRTNHQRKPLRYNGLDEGGQSDHNVSDGMTAELEAEIAALEGVARLGASQTGPEADQAVQRFTDSLCDLGSQVAIEAGVTRLTTAHAALTTHLTSQTRILSSLTSSLLSPLAPAPPPEIIDTLLTLIPETLSALPAPSPTPLYALHSLTRSTHEVIHLLSYLSDTLHMSRQTSQVAARRLRTVKDRLVEFRRERELAEEGRHWIEQGGWDERLARRECKGACEDVVGGFERVCEGWREKLMAGMTEVGAEAVG